MRYIYPPKQRNQTARREYHNGLKQNEPTRIGDSTGEVRLIFGRPANTADGCLPRTFDQVFIWSPRCLQFCSRSAKLQESL